MTFKVNVFSDNDGVNADFLGSFKTKFGVEFDDVPVGKAWVMINHEWHFFAELPLMPDVDVYWNAIKDYKPTILTGCPAVKFATHAKGKHEWLETHRDTFGQDTKMIVCLTKDKPIHMIAKGDILIDDHQKNITAWNAAGGNGILFINAHQAAAEFEALIVKMKAEYDSAEK